MTCLVIGSVFSKNDETSYSKAHYGKDNLEFSSPF